MFNTYKKRTLLPVRQEKSTIRGHEQPARGLSLFLAVNNGNIQKPLRGVDCNCGSCKVDARDDLCDKRHEDALCGFWNVALKAAIALLRVQTSIKLLLLSNVKQGNLNQIGSDGSSRVTRPRSATKVILSEHALHDANNAVLGGIPCEGDATADKIGDHKLTVRQFGSMMVLNIKPGAPKRGDMLPRLDASNAKYPDPLLASAAGGSDGDWTWVATTREEEVARVGGGRGGETEGGEVTLGDGLRFAAHAVCGGYGGDVQEAEVLGGPAVLARVFGLGAAAGTGCSRPLWGTGTRRRVGGSGWSLGGAG